MTQVVVPVRYPLTEHSRATLAKAIDIASEEDASLTVLHVNLYQNGKTVTRAQLKETVEEEFGPLPNARYAVRNGLLVEETILEEVAAESVGAGVGVSAALAGRMSVARFMPVRKPGPKKELRPVHRRQSPVTVSDSGPEPGPNLLFHRPSESYP